MFDGVIDEIAFNAADLRLIQLRNIEAKAVPDAVLKKGTVCREVQPLNIEPKAVPSAVLNKGTV
jgi:hypothetical protein